MSENEEVNFSLGLRKVITLTFEEDNVPEVDLGNSSPMEAYAALTAALQTVNLLIPHCNIFANGKEVLSVMDFSEEDPD